MGQGKMFLHHYHGQRIDGNAYIVGLFMYSHGKGEVKTLLTTIRYVE